MQEEHNVIQHFMSLVGQVKLFHWATMSYAKHKALDELYEALSDKVDLFIEAYIGRSAKRQPLKKFVIETKSTTDTKQIEPFLEAERTKLLNFSSAKLADCPDLSNIVEEMVAEINKALYICRMRD